MVVLLLLLVLMLLLEQWEWCQCLQQVLLSGVGQHPGCVDELVG